MKTVIQILSALLISISASLSIADDYIVAITANQAIAKAESEAKLLLDFALKREAGDRVLFVDADNLSLLGEFVIPEQSAYASPKARLQFNGAAARSVLDYARNTSYQSSKVGKPISLPDVLPFIADNLISEGTKTEILIMGTPLYHEDDERGLSMLGGRFPSDGHLFASRADTPYSASGSPDRLKGVRVHMAYEPHALQDQQYRYYVKRFWTLYIEKQSGELVSFVSDPSVLLRNVNGGTNPPTHDFEAQPSDKLEMIILQPAEAFQEPIFRRNLSDQPATMAGIIRAESVEVGISWDCEDCDLDLYAQAFPSAQPLYFGHTETPEGRYWKDYQNSPNLTKGFETISFNAPLDLRALSLAVNFYSGHAPEGVQGEIRLSMNGQTYGQDFYIAGVQGKPGGVVVALRDRASDQETITYIDPLQIVGQPISF